MAGLSNGNGRAMSATSEEPSAKIELLPASREHESILANLLELYVHDFSEFYPLELGADGRFGYQHLPLYLSEPNRYPFLVKVDGKLAGFAFVKRAPGVARSGEIWDMAEFFIVRAYRKRGIGRRVAGAVWERFPGLWEVRVMESNRAARGFWMKAVADFSGVPVEPVTIEKDGMHWLVFAFESGAVFE
jgi:predicted acetyltransferase